MSHRARLAALAALAAGLLLAGAALGPAQAQNFPENDPQHCSAIWKAVGIPKGSADARSTIVCHLGYVVGHNDEAKGPNWVIEHLTPDLTEGDATRESQQFSADDKLKPAAQAKPADYDGSGFDQGHNAPAADFAGQQKFLDDTFFLSNAVPQVGIGFNRSIWRSLETQVRNLVGDNHQELYVITGSIWQDDQPVDVDACSASIKLPTVAPPAICPENHEHKKAACPAGVAVPSAMFKIVYDPAAQTAFAVLMQNINHTGKYKSGKGADYIQAHRVKVATIENLTGLTFFTALSERKRKQIRANCVDVRRH